MRHSLQLSLVVAGACLTGANGCQPAAKPAADADRATATTGADDKASDSDGADSKPAAGRMVKPVTATRDERALASLSARADEAPRLGIGNLKRKEPGADSETAGAMVVEASKASSPLLQTASAAARAASATGVMSSERAPVRENLSDEGADAEATTGAN